MVQILLTLKVRFRKNSEVENLFESVPSNSEQCLSSICSRVFLQTLNSAHLRRLSHHLGGFKSRNKNPQKLTQLSSRSHPRHLVGKRTAQKDITIDTTSDSQVNSNFPNRWSPASLTFNNYFYLFLYLYIS